MNTLPSNMSCNDFNNEIKKSWRYVIKDKDLRPGNNINTIVNNIECVNNNLQTPTTSSIGSSMR